MKKTLPKGVVLLVVLLAILLGIVVYKGVSAYQFHAEEEALHNRAYQNDRVYNYISSGGSAFLRHIEFDGENSTITLKQEFYECIPVACETYNYDPTHDTKVSAEDVFGAFNEHLNELIDESDDFKTINSFVNWCGTFPQLLDRNTGQSVSNSVLTNYAFANSRAVEPDWVYPWEYVNLNK